MRACVRINSQFASRKRFLKIAMAVNVLTRRKESDTYLATVISVFMLLKLPFHAVLQYYNAFLTCFRLMRVQRRINKGFEVFEYYTNKQWDFKNEYVVTMRRILNERERLEFKIEGDDLDIDEYIEDCIHAARLYILKESPETIPAARRHMRV
jgi:Male sterility protein.